MFESKEKEATNKTVIRDFELPIEGYDQEAEALAHIYVQEGIIPKKKFDARHIGLATIKSFDILLSWNFRHFANVNKRNRIRAANEEAGYFYPLDLVTPIQLMYDEHER